MKCKTYNNDLVRYSGKSPHSTRQETKIQFLGQLQLFVYLLSSVFFFNVNKRVEENEFQVVPNDLIPYKYKIIYCLSVIVLVVYINIEVILVFYEQGERKH